MTQETLAQYRERTEYMWESSFAECGGFQTSSRAATKVDPEGRFRPFYGDTLIFSLPEPMIHWLEGVQQALYAACGECLAERIAPETFHITLHDLLNQAECMPEGVEQNRRRVMPLLAEAQEKHAHPIAVRSNCAFNMRNTSIVMGFEPAAEEDCTVLMSLFEGFQQIVPLARPLTLHVTLAYYKPGNYNEETLLRLRETVQRIGRERQEWKLDMRMLHYATFESMAGYQLASNENP